jgi:two-component system, OmpR family, sensor histidine kinase CiaH
LKDPRKKLVLLTIVYWLMLSYIIAALIWWFISLERQNQQMFALKLESMKKDEPSYQRKADLFEVQRQRKTTQYIGEGATFLLLIIVGAVFVYRAARRQLSVSQQQQNFMMAVTHELKTPIAVARLNLETMLKRKLDETQQQKLLAATLQETKRLNELCSNILVTSQLEAGAYFISKQELNLVDLAARTVEDFCRRFPSRKIDLQLDIEQVYVNGEPLLLQMLISNLVDNALKYSPKDSTVTIQLREEQSKAILTVADEGAGIEEAERSRIFNKFYRIGNENTRNAKGTGLGLYLCKKIAADHNGYIAMTNNVPQGSIFTVILQAV